MPSVSRRPTMRDIADRLDVSVSAVSIALSERKGVSPELREHIRRTASVMGYTPDRTAVALRTRRTGVIGLLIRNLQNPFFLDIIEGFDRECSRHGYQAMISSAHYDATHEQELLDTFAARGVDALAIAPIGSGRSVRTWARSTGRPVLVLNSSRLLRGEIHALRPDGVNAVRLAVEHLAGLGHRRIALLTAPADVSPDPERVDAFADEAARRRLRPRIVESLLTHEAAGKVLDGVFAEARARRPTALITNSDWLAYSAYAAAERQGLVIPDDLSIVGHDDLPMSSLLRPALTTVAVDRVGLGVRAARILIGSLDKNASARPVREQMPVELVVRRSTSAPPRR